jgi:hypothetical protein
VTFGRKGVGAGVHSTRLKGKEPLCQRKLDTKVGKFTKVNDRKAVQSLQG